MTCYRCVILQFYQMNFVQGSQFTISSVCVGNYIVFEFLPPNAKGTANEICFYQLNSGLVEINSIAAPSVQSK
jgi:hypothetical protein